MACWAVASRLGGTYFHERRFTRYIAAGPAYFAEGGLVSPDPLKPVLPGQFVAAATGRKLAAIRCLKIKLTIRER